MRTIHVKEAGLFQSAVVIPVRGGGLFQDPRVVSLQSALQPQQLSQDVWCVVLNGLVVHVLLQGLHLCKDASHEGLLGTPQDTPEDQPVQP